MSTITKQNREYLYDNIRGILILLVVLGHALEYFRLDNKVGEFLYVFIYLFHMPVFIFISGYFSKNLKKGRSTAVETFLVPYLLLNLILTLIMLAIGKIDQFMILSPGWTLWYLYCMFIWRLLLPDLVKVRRILILSFIIGIFSGFLTEFGTYMAMARTLGFLPYFFSGVIIRLPNTSLESARFLFEEQSVLELLFLELLTLIFGPRIICRRNFYGEIVHMRSFPFLYCKIY